ncbi:MAG: hypothetical protein QOF98_2450 [Streptomyces sp.]|jgi:hypothetical protein|nr:hypothetical protein [Streptomyces sp.]
MGGPVRGTRHSIGGATGTPTGFPPLEQGKAGLLTVCGNLG